MWFKIKLIAVTFLVCTAIVVVLLNVAYVPFTPVWLLPIVGGMLTGIAGASFNQLLRRPACPRRLSGEYIEASVQLVLGVAFLGVGFVYI